MGAAPRCRQVQKSAEISYAESGRGGCERRRGADMSADFRSPPMRWCLRSRS